MSLAREKALLLGETLQTFYQYVYNHYEKKKISFDVDKIFRLKCLLDEFQFDLLGKEISRINTFMWMEQETAPLLIRVKKYIKIMEEYVENNKADLFLFSPRIMFIKNLVEWLEEGKDFS